MFACKHDNYTFGAGKKMTLYTFQYFLNRMPPKVASPLIIYLLFFFLKKKNQRSLTKIFFVKYIYGYQAFFFSSTYINMSQTQDNYLRKS
jgi:mannose/fructose/N-acetylgalactosamine-specific phosphotransferase system component IID